MTTKRMTMKLVAMAALLVLPGVAVAESYSYSGGSYSGSGRGYSYHSGGGSSHSAHGHTAKPTPVRTSSSSSRSNTVRRTAHYRTGGSGYGFLRQRSGEDTSTGYSGANTSINTPHRSDWNAKLKAQRKWDENQYAEAQAGDRRSTKCGFTNSPAYCYRLQGPYPSEMKIVRY